MTDKKITKWLLGHLHPDKDTDRLISYAPKIIKDENKYYVSQLKKVTRCLNAKDNNIALEGDYGTGKSSILTELKSHLFWRALNRPKTISFLSFSTIENTAKQKNQEETTTQKIQKEIVKQLYFGQRPNKLKNIGYKRLGKSYFVVSFAIALMITAFFAPIFFSTNLLDVINSIKDFFFGDFGNNWRNGIITVSSGLSLIILSALLNLFFKTISNKDIKHISAKDISIDLYKENLSFDEFTDLLILYFRKTKCRVIIFEDIDRFNNTEIFEKLHQLNFVLNNRLWALRKIKFIYAIKEYIPNNSNPNEVNQESIKAKVFDIIIPVIPFLSEINFELVFEEEYKKSGIEHKINGVTNILSRHTTDMRVVKAVINNYITYSKIYDLRTTKDYRNCMGLSIIRVFEPEEFSKLSSGNSILDKIQNACLKYKEKIQNSIEDKYTVSSKIKNHQNEIWDALKNENLNNGTTLINTHPQNIVIAGESFPANDENVLIRIYHATTPITIVWSRYGGRSYQLDQLQGVFKNFVEQNPQDNIDKEKELRNNITGKDTFSYYERVRYNDNKNKQIVYNGKDILVPAVIDELIENGFITEEFTKFIARSTVSKNSDDEKAMKYIFNNIHGQLEDMEYVINGTTAKKILEKIDNTDLSSHGMYNFMLFDYILKNKEKNFEKLDRILESAQADIEKFMDFFDEYCHRYEEKLSSIDSPTIPTSLTNKLVETIPPLALTSILAKKYPDRLFEKISQSKLEGTIAKEAILTIAIANLDNPETLRLKPNEQDLLEQFSNQICKNADARKILSRLYITNSIKIQNLDILEIEPSDIMENLDKIVIAMNENNIPKIPEDILKEYISLKKLSADDFFQVMRFSNKNIKLYVVKNLDDIMKTEADFNKCIDKAAAFIYNNKLPVDYDRIKQYAKIANENAIIKILLRATITKEEMSAILENSTSHQLRKINRKNSIIKLRNNCINKKFADQLEDLHLIKRINSKNSTTIQLKVTQ